MSKGSNPRPYAVSQKKFADNWEKVFGEKKPVEAMRYLPDPETGKMIPEYMWDQYDLRPKQPPRTHHIIRDTPDYTSPITGEVISGRRQHRYDLAKHDCRVYEGRESEQRAADSHTLQESRKLDRKLDDSMAKTLNDMRHQNNPPPSEKINWTFGDD